MCIHARKGERNACGKMIFFKKSPHLNIPHTPPISFKFMPFSFIVIANF